MRRATNRKLTFFRSLMLAGIAAAMLAGLGAAPARADDWGRHGDGYWQQQRWREHAWRERHGWVAPRYYAPGYAPGYVYAPPPAGYAYAPPPVAYPPPAYVQPGLNLGFYFR
jgi:hypothetical protein